MSHPHIFFFPFFINAYITPYERGLKANAVALRNFFNDIVIRRRESIAQNPKLKEAGDFLTILLTEELFMNDNDRIVDECLTFFFGGTQTSAVTSQNLIVALLKHPNYEDRIL